MSPGTIPPRLRDPRDRPPPPTRSNAARKRQLSQTRHPLVHPVRRVRRAGQGLGGERRVRARFLVAAPVRRGRGTRRRRDARRRARREEREAVVRERAVACAVPQRVVAMPRRQRGRFLGDRLLSAIRLLSGLVAYRTGSGSRTSTGCSRWSHRRDAALARARGPRGRTSVLRQIPTWPAEYDERERSRIPSRKKESRRRRGR